MKVVRAAERNGLPRLSPWRPVHRLGPVDGARRHLDARAGHQRSRAAHHRGARGKSDGGRPHRRRVRHAGDHRDRVGRCARAGRCSAPPAKTGGTRSRVDARIGGSTVAAVRHGAGHLYAVGFAERTRKGALHSRFAYSLTTGMRNRVPLIPLRMATMWTASTPTHAKMRSMLSTMPRPSEATLTMLVIRT